jgi:hypothetical protein
MALCVLGVFTSTEATAADCARRLTSTANGKAFPYLACTCGFKRALGARGSFVRPKPLPGTA